MFLSVQLRLGKLQPGEATATGGRTEDEDEFGKSMGGGMVTLAQGNSSIPFGQSVRPLQRTALVFMQMPSGAQKSCDG